MRFDALAAPAYRLDTCCYGVSSVLDTLLPSQHQQTQPRLFGKVNSLYVSFRHIVIVSRVGNPLRIPSSGTLVEPECPGPGLGPPFPLPYPPQKKKG